MDVVAETAGRAPGKPYPNQRRAAAPDTSVWVEASAGSGKTKVLADRVIRLMLAGTPPERILCLTFTRAAAAQMSNRINEILGGWAAADDGRLRVEIEDLTGTAPDTDTCSRARRLFAEVLDVPGGMKVQTIHAFCESLLGRFPLEAGIAPHFEVMDERTAAELTRDARDDVLRSAAADTDGPLSAALAEVTYRIGEQGFTDLIEQVARERGRLARLLDHEDGPDGYRRRVYERLAVAEGTTEQDIADRACADDAFDAEGLATAAEALGKGKKSDVDRAALIAPWLAGSEEARCAGFDAYRRAFLTKDGEPQARLVTKDVAADTLPRPRIFSRRRRTGWSRSSSNATPRSSRPRAPRWRSSHPRSSMPIRRSRRGMRASTTTI